MMDSEDTLVGFVCRSLKTKKRARQFGVLREGNDGDIGWVYVRELEEKREIWDFGGTGFGFPLFFLGFP